MEIKIEIGLAARRAAEKAAARRADLARLEAGEDPAVLQRENSIFPEGFFKGARIENLGDAIGRR